ncbi:MAG TPA: indole-3-glycerol-phosphate synthase [Steroidobacteraceae bacterium]|nr:indole-3-glycerol-phosphate synthase [Steroidobacteraceae bacterium]
MSGFLDDMAKASAARVAEALRHESFEALERRARQAMRAAPLRLSAAGFDVIAELKLRSPAAGVLGDESQDWLGRVAAYARGGAAAVSVLTEPSRFDGSLEHLRRAAAALAPLGVPAMRKDFLVDPYQVLEARAAGAGGVLVILRMLPRRRIEELLDVAAEHGLFVLLEAFDEADLELARHLSASRAQADVVRKADVATQAGHPLLIGVNSRDLQTLKVRQERFAALAPRLPEGLLAVAESGVASAADARHMRELGYGAALIGTALMARADPGQLLREIIDATRTVQP